MRTRSWVLSLCCLLSLSLTAEAGTRVKPDAEGMAVMDDQTGQVVGRLALGPVREALVVGPVAYAALATGGLVAVDLSEPARPKVLHRFAEGGQFIQLLVQGERLLAIEARHELVAFTLKNPQKPEAALVTDVAPWVAAAPATTAPGVEAPASAPPTELARPAAVVHVVEVSQGRAIFDAGTNAGLEEGARVRILSQRLVWKPDLVSGGLKQVPSNEVVAVLRIEQAEETRSMAPLSRGDVVEVQDLALPTEEPVTERLFVSRRPPFQLRAGFHARPFLGLSTAAKPVGFLLDAFGSYYFTHVPAKVELSVSPLGLTFNARDRHYPSSVSAVAAYTTDYFEIGLGAGSLVGAPGPCVSSSNCESNTGLTINQLLRLGSIDGLNATWHSSIFSRPQEFVFGVGRGELNVPLTNRLGLFGGGGGGENGWAFGEFGVRTYVGGVGATGTVIISASLGYAAIFDGPQSESVGGPSVAFGMEWRQ